MCSAGIAKHQMRIFLALPDGGLAPEIERAMREAAVEAKHELLADAPHAHAGLAKSERDRFLTVVDRMMEADLLLADVSKPDAGVGWCVAWFLARGRLVVLTVQKEDKATLASMIAGNPSPWQRVVTYERPELLHAALAKALSF